jgi:hypothetical protein
MSARFIAVPAAGVMLVLPSIAHTGVDAAIIEYRLDFCEHRKTTQCNILGINIQKVAKSVTHLGECAMGHVRHVSELESSSIYAILVRNK